MKKIINSSRPVVVTTTRTPLNGSLTIDAGGASLSQVYDAIYGTWAPVDRRQTPLVLTPVVSVVDPDTGQQVPLSKLQQVEYKWYVGNSTTPVTSRTPSDDYHQQTDDDTATGVPTGALVVRHNVSPADHYAVPILCEFSCVDSGRGERYTLTAAVLLSSENKVQDMLTVALENANVFTFNPITEDSSLKTFKAVAYTGSDPVPTGSVKYFWYVNDVLADTKACYVSGQHTDTLVLDAQYADKVQVKVRIATVPDGASPASVTVPNHPAKAEATLLWQWPDMKAIPYSQSGEAIKLQSDTMKFGAIVQAYGKDITTAKRNKYVKLRWYTQPTDTMTKKDQGVGYEKTIQGSDLFRTGGRKVNVQCDVFLLGVKASSSSAAAETKIENAAPPVVITTVRTPLTGSLSIDTGGASLSQVYDAINGTWAPVDRRSTPLVLAPVISLTDPDTGQSVPLADMQNVDIKWYVDGSTTPVTSRTPSDDYHQQTDDDTATGTPTGSLVVRRNIGPEDQYAVDILCELSCTDGSRAELYKFDAAVMLTAENKVQDMITVAMENPATMTYNPILQHAASQRTFKAVAYNGSDPLAAARVKYFWYLDDDLIDGNTIGYVSGQNTDTLVLDAEYLDNVLVNVRIATVPDGTPAASITAPNHPARAEATLLWQWPKLDVLPYSMNGEAIKDASRPKTFRPIVQAYGKDVDESLWSRYFRFNWYTQPTDTMTRKDQGWGTEVTVSGTDLFRSGGVHVNVGVDLYTLGAYRRVVDAQGRTVVDGQGRVVVCPE